MDASLNGCLCVLRTGNLSILQSESWDRLQSSHISEMDKQLSGWMEVDVWILWFNVLSINLLSLYDQGLIHLILRCQHHTISSQVSYLVPARYRSLD